MTRQQCFHSRPGTGVTHEVEVFLPFFLARAQRTQLVKLLPTYYQSRMRLYYRLHGCIRCNRNDKPHYSAGACCACYNLIRSRLLRLDQKYGAVYRDRESAAAKKLLDRLTSAQKLLRDLREVL
jgi:hypothetical protein